MADIFFIEWRIGVHSQRRRPLRRSQHILKLVLPPLDRRTILLKLPEARELCQVAEQRVGFIRVQSVLCARLNLLGVFAIVVIHCTT